MKGLIFTLLAMTVGAPLSATVITYTAGTTTEQAHVYTVTFDDLLPPQTLLSYSVPGATYSNLQVVQGSSSGQWAAPPSDSSLYLTVGSPGGSTLTTIAFSASVNYFGIYVGSPDTYNSLTVHYANGLSEVFNGAYLTETSGDGTQSVGVYVNFFFDSTVSSIELASSSAAFESDNHAFGEVPEPATAGLLGLGVWVLGMWRRMRR